MNAGAKERAALRTALAWVAVVALLAVENFWMFADQYAGRATLPHDFSLTYFAAPFYWQGLARVGIFPQWIPYQAFGYPFALNLQTGLFYPPFWILVLTHVTYSLRVAVSLQLLHVLLGGVGAAFLARARRMPWTAAILAGCAFQLFGGFFSNAQHPDIVRGYALTPWLLATLTLADGESLRHLARRHWLVVPIVVCIMTGAYPGQMPATLALGFLYLGLEVLDQSATRDDVRRAGSVALLRGALIVVGAGIATISFVPGLVMKHEILRSAQAAAGTLSFTGFDLNEAFTTLFPYDNDQALANDIAMRSLFVTVPVLMGLFLVGWADIKQHRALVVVGLVAALLIQAGGVHRIVVRILPPLGLSRFPAADYRAALAIPMVLLGALGLARVMLGRPPRALAARALAALVFVVVGANRFHWQALDVGQLGALAFTLIATWMLIAIGTARALPATVSLAAALLLVCYDGARMHQHVTFPWIGRAWLRGFSTMSDFDAAREELERSARERRQRRPARVLGDGESWRSPILDGYMRGRFVADDYVAGFNFRAIAALRADAALAKYMIAEASPRLLPAPLTTTAHDAPTAAAAPGSVVSTEFRAEELRYRVSTPGDAILVENEPAFPGWTAAIVGSATRLEPEGALWPLRAWRLPKGDYEVRERFRLPGLILGEVVSVASLLLWLALIAWRVRERLRRSSA